MLQLRQTQIDILSYQGGKMGVAAVPGSGKTFILTHLATKLIEDGRINPNQNQQVLIVTYLNASVDNFKSRIRERLQSAGLNPDAGYDVRTLHSLSLEILRSQYGGDREQSLIVLDEGQSDHFLGLAIDQWQLANFDIWMALLPDENEQSKTKWMRKVERMAKAFIRQAKNRRYRPEGINARLAAQLQLDSEADEAGEPADFSPIADGFDLLLRMLTGIYSHYQSIVLRQGAIDFNDLIWQATDLIENSVSFRNHLRQRWPFILEDEAQDSVPLQEVLLDHLTGPEGNWVRVGDPNQAITSSFTSAHPDHLRHFLEREDVTERPLPHSGRCAPKILAAANRLMDWTVNSHPIPEVRRTAFLPQRILPTPEGDAQVNPPDSEANIVIKVYGHREDEELPKVAYLASRYVEKFPERTIAILCPTHDIGHKVAVSLDQIEAVYDNLLRGGTREREIAAGYHSLLNLMVDPLRGEHYRAAYLALNRLDHPVARLDPSHTGRLEAILRSVRQPEKLVFPWSESEDLVRALPAGVPLPEDLEHIAGFALFLQRIFELRSLPIDDLLIALGDELLAQQGTDINETDLAIAYQLANMMRAWGDLNPEWRLPQYVDQLKLIADGRQHVSVVSTEEGGFEPRPGRITLTTQHGAKGLEWDAVFLVGVDSRWIPNSLEGHFLGVDDQLGVDLSAEVTAQLLWLMEGNDGTYAGHSPTGSAHIDVIAERLRLLYVGITRAKRFLQISRSRKTRRYQQDRDAEPTTALGVLYEYVKTMNDK